MTKASEQIRTLISQAKADVQLAAACFPLIAFAPKEEQPHLLKEFLLGYKTLPTTGELKLPKAISDDEEQRGILRYRLFVSLRLQELAKADLDEEEFYAQLWDFLLNSPLFPNAKARIVALFNCALDRRLPYYKLDRDQALSMTDEEYAEACDRIGDDVFARMDYILDTDFDQRTEQASLIMQMMDELPDYDSRCIFMSRIISHYSLRFHMMSLDRAIERLQKEEDQAAKAGD